ncbi:MAG: hypothetical protein J0L84_14095 [Verrucomicrobia bacterium]|nr:hypothetical protein [Verrucomicrobiota bacterium]
MQVVWDRLVQELEKPRPITPQVLRHLASAFGVERTEVGPFLDQRLGTLEEVELDLLLSPLFTPKLADQAVFAALLAGNSVPATQVSEWVSRLEARPVVAQLVTPEGTVHPAPLKRVTLERYVLRLRLEGAVPAPLERLIATLPPASERPLLLAIARRAIWNTPERVAVLERFLARAYAGDEPAPAPRDADSLLALMEGAEPADMADLQRRLPAWEQVVRTQIASAAQPSPFFNERVQDLHGGGRDQRSGSEPLRVQKQAELEFLGRLARWMSP